MEVDRYKIYCLVCEAIEMVDIYVKSKRKADIIAKLREVLRCL